MARNGVEFGIRMSGTGDRWLCLPAPRVRGLYVPGYGDADAALDLGDSAITETAGLGGFAMAAPPAIASSWAVLPVLDFAGSPSGIDARKVVDRHIVSVINTDIAHRAAGVGQVGAGICEAPLACFVQAVSALGELIPA